jgi:hypothetical protein
MQAKLCSRCGTQAEYSIYSFVSTLGRKPRIQESTESLLFCTSCLHACQRPSDIQPSLGVERLVYVALSTIEAESAAKSNPESAITPNESANSAPRSGARFLSLIKNRLIETP